MPYCRNCGHNVAAEARVCPNCNYPQDTVPSAPDQPQTPQVPQAPQQSQASGAPTGQAPQTFPGGAAVVRRTDGQATAALVLGILGPLTLPICGVGLVLSLIALIIGKQSMNRIEGSGSTLEGYGMAKAGFILGIIGLILGLLGILFIVGGFIWSMSVEGF